METPNLDDWRTDISDNRDQVKIKDGEVKTFVFADEGKKNVHPDYGTSIEFRVIVEGDNEPKRFFVKENNYSLLQQIKVLGKLVGQKVKIARVGSTKSNTRYKLEAVAVTEIVK